MGEEKSNVVITEEGALSVKKLTFWEAAMIIVGANIGAGILGLAYSSRKAGWPILLMWLIIAGVFTTVSMLYVAETTLRTKKPMQLPGLAERYVGKLGGGTGLYFCVRQLHWLHDLLYQRQRRNFG